MDRKDKLSKLILIEAETLKEAKGLTGSVNLAEEITKDAIALATIVQEEINPKQEERKMAKVISISTRQEVTELPFNEKDATKAIEALIKAKIADPVMFARLLNFITNNSGVSAFGVQQALVAKRTKKVGN
jgi:hypothetical protein